MEPYSTFRNHVIRARPDRCIRVHILAIVVLVRWPQQHSAVAHELVSLNLPGIAPMGRSDLHSLSPYTFSCLACQVCADWNVLHGGC
jgi:hypothetical protein